MTSTRAASAWALLGGAGTRGVSFLFFLLITRELTPAQMGVMALALAFGVIVDAVIDLGLSDQVLRRLHHDRPQDQAFFSAVFGAQALVGSALCGAVWWGAPFIAQAFGLGNDLQAALAGVMLASFAGALGLLPSTLMMRRLQYRFMALRSTVAAVAGGGIGLFLARQQQGIDALVAMHVINAVTAAGLAWWGSRWRPAWPGLAPAWHSVRPVSPQAAQTLATKLLEALVSRLDQIIIGSFFGAAALGLYALAMRLYEVLFQALCNPVAAVILTHLGVVRDNLGEFNRRFESVLRHAALFLAPVFVGAGLFLPTLLPWLFGPHWQEAAPFIQVVMAVGAVQAIGFTHCPAFTALGRQEANLGVTVASAVVWVLLMASGWLTGAMSVALLWAVRAGVGLALQRWLMRRFSGQALGALWRATRPLWLTTAGVTAVTVALNQLNEQLWHSPLATLALSITLSMAAFAVTGWLSSELARHHLSASWRNLRKP